jgi:hypothetical protein
MPAHGRFATVRYMTILWFVVWFVADRLGGHAPLHFAPVNAWAWTLLLAVALDLSSQHARRAK